MSTNFAQLIVSEEGGGQATVEAVPVSDRIHILRVGDTLTSPGKANIDDRRRFVFDPLVTHADGKLVSSSNPAQAGETLVLYAVGLGRVRPAAKSGEITPMSAPISTVVIGFAFNFRGEVSPQMPPFTDSNLKAAVFAGLSPG